MTTEPSETPKCIKDLEKLFKTEGVKALSSKWLNDNGHRKLYNNVTASGKGVIKALAVKWNVSDELKTRQRVNTVLGRGQVLWDADKIHTTILEIIATHGYIPPAEYLRQNGHGSFVSALYNNNMSYETLQLKYNVVKDPKFWSRDAKWWRSMAEASFANYLYARGVTYKKGELYPEEYGKTYDHKSGNYDVHFMGRNNQWYDVEIWGEKPNGHSEKEYLAKRHDKEEFNKNNPYFIGLSFRSCYSEDALYTILSPHIDISKEPTVFAKESDRKIKSVNWSRIDEVLEQCTFVKEKLGNIPSFSWFSHQGPFKNRPRCDWERDDMRNLYKNISAVGGIRLIRGLLRDTTPSPTLWSQESIITELKRIYKEHGVGPTSLRFRLYRKANSTPAEIALCKEAGRLCAVCDRNFEGKYKEAAARAGIPPPISNVRNEKGQFENINKYKI